MPTEKKGGNKRLLKPSVVRARGDFTERRLSSKRVYRGGFFDVYKDAIRRPDGKPVESAYIKHPGAVRMLPLLDEHTVLLVHQFRYPLGRHYIELPAGKLEPGEKPLATTKRELVEECGY